MHLHLSKSTTDRIDHASGRGSSVGGLNRTIPEAIHALRAIADRLAAEAHEVAREVIEIAEEIAHGTRGDL